MNKTLVWVGDEPRTFDSKYGPLASIKVKFEDEVLAELTTKPDKVAERIATLKALIGKPGEYGLEDKGKWDDGNPKPAKLTDYPGKVQYQGDGSPSGGKFRGRSPEEIRSIQRQTALIQAVALRSAELGAGATHARTDLILEYAQTFIDWLEKPAAGVRPQDAEAPSPASSSPPAAGSSDAPDAYGEGATKAPDTGGEAGTPQQQGSDSPPDSPASEEQVERAIKVYGSKVKLLRRAGELYGVATTGSLTNEQATALIKERLDA